MVTLDDIFDELLKDKLLSVNEVSQIIGLSPQRVNQLIFEGRLKAVKKINKTTVVLKKDLINFMNLTIPQYFDFEKTKLKENSFKNENFELLSVYNGNWLIQKDNGNFHVIFGTYGSGKTTYLKKIALRSLEDNTHVVIIDNFNNFKDCLEDEDKVLYLKEDTELIEEVIYNYFLHKKGKKLLIVDDVGISTKLIKLLKVLNVEVYISTSEILNLDLKHL